MVRFGIVGFGLHAVKRLMPGFAQAKNCRVTALSRRDPAKAKDSARQWDIPLAFTSTKELCQSPEVDAVFVTSPNSIHFPDVMDSIAAGKHVLCEKPMGMNAEECRRMVEAAHKANVLLGVAHVFRFENSTNRMREHIVSGHIGKPVFARSEFCFAAGREHARKWIHDNSLAGGGPIVDVGVHCIDTLRFVLQDEVESVRALAAYDPASRDVEASASLMLEFERGTLATVLVSFRADYRSPVEIIGDGGVLFADECLNVERPINLQLRRGEMVETEVVSNFEVYGQQVDAFANAIEGKARFPIPGEDGWQNQEILDAAYRSIKSGKAEAVPRVRVY